MDSAQTTSAQQTAETKYTVGHTERYDIVETPAKTHTYREMKYRPLNAQTESNIYHHKTSQPQH